MNRLILDNEASMPSDSIPITRNRAQHLRNLPRNSSGRDATVRMATYSGGENNDRYFAAPTITFKGDEPARPQSFDEALNAGEVYEFMSKKRAEKFAAGSWKQGKARREVTKGVDEFGDPCVTCKQVTISTPNKEVVKKKYIDEDGTRRKLKTTYKDRSSIYTLSPDVATKTTFTMKGGGIKKRKERY